MHVCIYILIVMLCVCERSENKGTEGLKKQSKMVRTPSCDKSGLKKGTWTPEEDRKLIAYITRYGCWNWRQLPKYAGLARCGKSCRLRWLNYLRPNIKRGNYAPEEEQLIIQLHHQLGNRWSAIAAKLPGRTDNDIKNYWHTNLKKKIQDKSGKQQAQAEENESSGKMDQVNNNTSAPCDDNKQTMWNSSSRPSIDQSSSSLATTGGSHESSWIVEEDDNDEFAFLNALADVNFWTDPFVANMIRDPTQTAASLPPFLTNHQPDYCTMDPSCDALLWTPHNLVYDQYSGLFF